jgi:hypothetical protein
MDASDRADGAIAIDPNMTVRAVITTTRYLMDLFMHNSPFEWWNKKR